MPTALARPKRPLAAPRPSPTPETTEGPFLRVSRVALYAYIILMFGRPQDMLGFAFPGLMKLAAAVLFGCWLPSVLFEGARPRLRSGPIRVTLSFLGLIAFSTLFAIVTMYGVHTFRYVGMHILLIILVASTVVRSRAQLQQFLTCFGLAVGFAALMGLRFYGAGGGGRWRRGFVGHFMADPNDFALYMNCFMPLLAYLAFTARRRLVRMAYWGVGAAGLLAGVLTWSRGGMLSLATMSVFLFVRARGARGRILLAGAVGGIILAIVMPTSYWDSIRSILPSTQRGAIVFDDGSTKGRYDAWRAAMNMAADRPLVGVGPGNFPSAMWATYRPKDVRAESAAHSIYFQTLGELGLLGIAWLGTLCVVNFRTLARVRARAKAAGDRETLLLTYVHEMSLAALLTGGAFLSVLYYPHLYWLSWMIGILDITTVERETTAEERPAAPRPALGPARRRVGSLGHVRS